MIITNKYNLPNVLIECVKDTHPIKEKHYSVTTLLQPVREILLTRRHYNEIEQDVSSMTRMIFGSAVHKLLEVNNKEDLTEYELKAEIRDGYFLTGICDLYNEKTFTLEDWKTSSVSKVLKQDFEDYRKQGLMYAWLLRKENKYVKKIKFNIFLRDYQTQRSKMDPNYPQTDIYVYEYDVTENDLIEIEKFIRNKFDAIIEAEKLSDNELPLCTMEERWNSGDKYALKKIGAVKASKICDTEAEAHQYITEHMGGGAEMEVRKGEDRKCRDYCNCKMFCSFYKSLLFK